MARIEALVKGDLLVWARESAGFTVVQAAKKASVKPESLVLWEASVSRPSIPQLRKLANVYKRPLAVFYLPERPRGFAAMHDFRRLPGEVSGIETPELRRAIRQAHLRRQVALDLHQDLEGDPPAFTVTATLDENPEAVGGRVRAALGVTYDTQRAWRNEYDALNTWRAALEAHGVLVLQVEDVKPDEMRGFSISETPLPAVVLNVSDPVRPRIFTMLHEAVHLALRDGGLCDLDEEQQRAPDEMRAEVFSNHAAGAALVPRPQFLAEPEVADQARVGLGRREWTDATIDALAQRYRVSREVVARRLVVVGLADIDFYLRKRHQYQQEYRAQAAQLAKITAARRAAGEKVSSGFAPPDVMAVTTAGPLLTRLILDGYHRELITSSDVADYLDIKLKHLPKIERAVVGATP